MEDYTWAIPILEWYLSGKCYLETRIYRWELRGTTWNYYLEMRMINGDPRGHCSVVIMILKSGFAAIPHRPHLDGIGFGKSIPKGRAPRFSRRLTWLTTITWGSHKSEWFSSTHGSELLLGDCRGWSLCVWARRTMARSQLGQGDARLFRAERADMRAGQANGQVMCLLRNLLKPWWSLCCDYCWTINWCWEKRHGE